MFIWKNGWQNIVSLCFLKKLIISSCVDIYIQGVLNSVYRSLSKDMLVFADSAEYLVFQNNKTKVFLVNLIADCFIKYN